MHDDQHGTAIVVLAGLLNALKIVKRSPPSHHHAGAGATGTPSRTPARIRRERDVHDRNAIWAGRKDLNAEKVELAKHPNPKHRKGTLADVMKGADVLVGTSGPGLVTADMVRSMAKKAIVFGLANPVPEIMPDVALSAGAAVVATGRSDFPNQVNNALCYPGLFRGMLDKRINKVTDAVKVRAARAIAGFVKQPTPERIIPSMFDRGLHEAVARSVRR